MGDEPGDGEADRRTRADVYSSARIGAAAALTVVLVVLLVLDVAVPGYDISPGILLRQMRELALEHAAARIDDAAYLGRMAGLRKQIDAIEMQRADDLPAHQALEWLDALAETWHRTDLPEEQSDVIHAVYERIVIEGPRFVSLASHRPPTGMDWRSRCPMLLWRARQDSNLRPSAPEA